MWNEEMSHACSVGVEDGKRGKRRGRPNDFEACYEQGYRHGQKSKVDASLHRRNKALQFMQDHLMTNSFDIALRP